MEVVETPWLRTARGGTEDLDDLINVLDPKITRAQRDAALAELKKSQTSLGGFPWWPGGPPSPWMTLYILHGFSKGLEFGVDAPKDVVVRAWSYMHRHYLDVMVDQMMFQCRQGMQADQADHDHGQHHVRGKLKGEKGLGELLGHAMIGENKAEKDTG